MQTALLPAAVRGVKDDIFKRGFCGVEGFRVLVIY